MIYYSNEETREISSNSGYIKRINDDYAVYTSPIYLGIFDNPSNYEVATEEEYNEFISKGNEEELEQDNNGINEKKFL